MFKSVGLVARFDRKKALRLSEELANYLKEKGLEVFLEDSLAKKTGTREKILPLQKMKTDLIVTIGGDGTILRTCISIPKPEPPILTVNMGVRGFLAEVDPRNAFSALDKCLNGEFIIEKCMKLTSTADSVRFPDALNEVVVSADEPAKLLYSRISKDSKQIVDCQSDGLMVATQTGSTGYSLSAGGPVLDPQVRAFVLTPICPISIFQPIVFPSDSRLTIEAERPKKIQITIDGHYRQIISSKHPSLTVTCSKFETSFVRLKENFYPRLRSRLVFKGMR